MKCCTTAVTSTEPAAPGSVRVIAMRAAVGRELSTEDVHRVSGGLSFYGLRDWSRLVETGSSLGGFESRIDHVALNPQPLPPKVRY